MDVMVTKRSHTVTVSYRLSPFVTREWFRPMLGAARRGHTLAFTTRYLIYQDTWIVYQSDVAPGEARRGEGTGRDQGGAGRQLIPVGEKI